MLLSRIRVAAATLAMVSAMIPVASLADTKPYVQRPEVQTFINGLVKTDGLNRQEVTRLMASAQHQQSIIDSMTRPAEKTMTWGRYRKIFITEDRINRGVEFYHAHRAALKRAERQYGIPPEIIVAIIGVETKYGANKGSYRIVDALSTLGFDYPPRAEFFRKQLREYLLLGREAGIDLGTATGSYAGAMGYPQFIPSSYRAFAVDFDADNKIDLINNPTDAIGSVANYFRKHHWNTGDAIVKRARYTGSPAGLAGLDKVWDTSTSKPAHKASTLAGRGLAPKTALPPATLVNPMRLVGDKGDQYWLGLNNFYVITRYNHSNLYAMAAFQLSQKIKEKL